jgi:hypothetical protein
MVSYIIHNSLLLCSVLMFEKFLQRARALFVLFVLCNYCSTTAYFTLKPFCLYDITTMYNITDIALLSKVLYIWLR